MVNKKGFIRTLEAVIAIVLILGFIFYITPKSVEFEEEVPEDVANAKGFILNQILYEKEYAKCIADVNVDPVCENVLDSTISNIDGDTKTCKEAIVGADGRSGLMSHIPAGYEFACEICSSSGTCQHPPIPPDRSIYTNSILIYKPGQEYNIMRIYIWRR